MRYSEMKPRTQDQSSLDLHYRQDREVRKDIQKIDSIASESDFSKTLELHRYLDAKYQYCVADWGKGMWGYDKDMGFIYNSLDSASLKENLAMMKPKLEAFMCGWNAVRIKPDEMPTMPDINVNTTTNVNITINFDQVREKIEDMTALSKKETDEAIEKVNELEAISKENISRKSKWEKIKPIIAFAMDKGADLGIAILTLIVQMKLGM